MRTKVIVINIITVIFVCGSFYYIKATKSEDYLLNKKDALISSLKSVVSGDSVQNTQSSSLSASTTVIQKILNKTVFAPIATKTTRTVVTPGPLESTEGNNIKNYTGSITVAGVIERTNYERAQNSLSGLIESSQLDASAQVKANDILARQYFEHAAPDGKTVSDLVTAAGYEYVRVGENLALGDFTSNTDLLTAWMNSPGHRANILDTRYQDIGIGVAYGNYKGRMVVVAVQHFGRPRSACPSVDDSIKNQINDLQSQSSKISSGLDVLKNMIDTKRANGEYVDNTIIDAYNNSVTQYDSLIEQEKTLRDEYNTEVVAFNACLVSL